jgi:NNP family nitrate/nitrite transporter-like MFS transporter
VNTRQRKIAFSYLFTVYFLCGMAETLVSPLFPLLREDLDLVEAQQATLLAAVAAGIAVFNVIGGAIASRRPDRSLVRVAAAALASGLFISGLAGSYPMLLAGQALVGVGFGLFYPSGLASVARMYEATRGRAIANYGLAYSLGLALAAVAANVGQSGWRWVFYVSGAVAVGLVVWAPRWVEAEPDTGGHSLLSQLRTYAAHRDYRISAVTTLTGLAMHYVVIGFAPVLYVDRGIRLSLVSVLLAVGRLGSIPGKLLCGGLFDRFGGLWVARMLMVAEFAVGIPMLALPGSVGVWLLVPFVAVSASVFPVANAMLVSALPPRSAWGIGTFRSVMLGASALLSGLVSVLLHHVSLPVVMAGALAVPALASLGVDATMRRDHRALGRTPEAAPTA